MATKLTSPLLLRLPPISVLLMNDNFSRFSCDNNRKSLAAYRPLTLHCGIFIFYIPSFFPLEVGNISSQNEKRQTALRAVVGFWAALARVESNRALLATGWRRESSTAADIAKRRHSLSPTVSTGSENVWNLAYFGSDSRKVRPVTTLALKKKNLYFVFPFPIVSRGSSPEGPWG